MTSTSRRSLSAALLLLMAPSLGCDRRTNPPAGFEGELSVFAAASLREAFSALGGEFERAHPQTKLAFNFAGTQELRTQIEQGAPADVFASADQRHMAELAKAGLVTNPTTFARNEPVVVVAPEAAELVREFAELGRAERIVLGAPDVPIGRYTQQILARAAGKLGTDFATRVEARVVSRELNVKQVLAKVSLGEAQAGIVYRTDANSADGKVRVVRIPEPLNVTAEYPIAVLASSQRAAFARAWIDFVLSKPGQAALAAAGFLGPNPSAGTP
jgi:molybdate transport system substrate-binding protein